MKCFAVRVIRLTVAARCRRMRVTGSVLRLPVLRCAVRGRGRMTVCPGVRAIGFGSRAPSLRVRVPGLVRGVIRRTVAPARRSLTVPGLAMVVSGSGMRAIGLAITVAGFARTRGGFPHRRRATGDRARRLRLHGHATGDRAPRLVCHRNATGNRAPASPSTYRGTAVYAAGENRLRERSRLEPAPSGVDGMGHRRV